MESNIVFPNPNPAQPPQLSSGRSSPRALEPKKQEWAIIYNQ